MSAIVLWRKVATTHPRRLQYLLPTAVLFALPIMPCAHGAPPTYAQAQQVIQHVIFIMQENRSFDNYFGTFPGANGFPARTCVPLDPKMPAGPCVKPFHDVHDIQSAAPHSALQSQNDIDDGINTFKMDGFVYEQTSWFKDMRRCPTPQSPHCTAKTDGVFRHDVMGYHNADEIPNYWAYAQHFVLQDRLFEGVRSWSEPSHLDMTSEWVASCTDWTKALSCVTDNLDPNVLKLIPSANIPWVNLFQLLDMHNVSWKYYLGAGEEPDCVDGAGTCDPQLQVNGVASIWNPVPYFSSVKAGGAAYLAYHNPNVNQYLEDIKAGQLPAVSWIVPAGPFSEHPPAAVTMGMEYVTSLVNAVMQSPAYWNNTAIFIAWDDWGGFYDQVVPPNIDTNDDVNPIQGFGLRVPGLMISAWAKAGMIDHQLFSFDSYATFFENLFLDGARLIPSDLGNPDNRPDIRDSIKKVKFPSGRSQNMGDFLNEFDFTQTPLPPLVLSTHIPTGITIDCRPGKPTYTTEACQLPKVTISWLPVTGPDIPGPFIYHIQRDGQELPQCVGTATKCADTPGSGNHLYRGYSVDSSGTSSPLSAAAEADEP